MKTNHMNLPANCSAISEDEMMYLDGGFELSASVVVPVVAIGAAVIAVGAMALNMLNWANGSSDTNFIQDSINAGQNFIDGSLAGGQGILDALLGK